MMLDFLINSFPPLILLLFIWSSLTLFYFFIKSQIKKEKKIINKTSNKDTRELSEEEINNLAIYVSHLPRPKDLLKKLELDQEDNN
ncbi:MAG: hypothetical protein KatS3mg068_0863 [Candidatus Sericytochromatia bacterium]|nr:MAG: hypothetical protein KatS3mg068_0863 [Candidatus Sericytochromatia bacterium]